MIDQYRRLTMPLLLGLTSLAHALPISFHSALQLAEQQSPKLAAIHEMSEAARSATIPAGALPDPKIVFGVDNFPVSGPDAGRLQSDFMTMQKIGVMQEFPNAEKLRARQAVAAADLGLAESQLSIARNLVRRDTALAWLDLYYLEHKSALLDELERENGILSKLVQAQLAAGRAQPADAVLPQQELARLADQRDDFTRDIRSARAKLTQMVGANLSDGLDGDPPTLEVNEVNLHTHLQRHPELLAYEAQTLKAEAQVREAQAMKKSDWSVELSFQRRAPQFGNMMSIQFSVDLPTSPSTRQDPLIEARRHELTRLDAERADMLRDHTSELESTLAQYTALSRQLERAENTALPLIEQKLALQLASYQAGKGDLNAVLAARKETIDQKMRMIDLTWQRAALGARLHFSYSGNEP